jgi:PPOX class probable F420-dependent enzyme
MEATAMRGRVSEARVARLATADADGRPHVVPITFALDGDTIFFAVDAKPKRTTDLKRLRNIAANPSVSVLVDHYDEDWNRLWWVRIDGTARVVDNAAQAGHALDQLVSRYPQYRRARPSGPVVAISIQRITGWAAAENPAR